jgi:XTP/dITP diphosphohydrolase
MSNNRKIIVASNNAHKVKEIKDILEGLPYDVVSLKEAGIDVEVAETGSTFMENAYIKASEIFNIAGGAMVLADDSGLMVDALNGAPGIYSARFAGDHGNSRENNEKLLSLLKDVPDKKRTAQFVCALVLIIDKDSALKVQGEIEGIITDKEKGKDGFGYDPLFFIPKFNMTFAEMDAGMKNSMSHRGNALKQLAEKLRELEV